MIENGNEMLMINIDNDWKTACVLWRLLAICDLAANFSGLARVALLWVCSDRNPSFKVEVDRGLTIMKAVS
jgi:hypothetical protein